MNSFSKRLAQQFAFTVPPKPTAGAGPAGPPAVHKPLSRQTLQDAVRCFVSRLVDKTVWSCGTCGTLSTAPVLIFDATCIAPPRALSCTPNVRQFGDHTKRGSAHANRVLVPDRSTRELIHKFCGRPVTKSESKVGAFGPTVRSPVSLTIPAHFCDLGATAAAAAPRNNSFIVGALFEAHFNTAARRRWLLS